MDDRSPEMLRPTLLSGLICGVPAAIPGLNVLNACTCCSFVWICGFLAAYMYSRACTDRGVEFRPGGGALVGLIAGAFYALFFSVASAVKQALVGNPFVRMMLEWIRTQPNLPDESLDRIDFVLEHLDEWSFLGIVVSFFGWVLIGAIFSTIGGLIGGAVFKVERKPEEQ
jgi:hypothetical protein